MNEYEVVVIPSVVRIFHVTAEVARAGGRSQTERRRRRRDVGTGEMPS
jgi:hypothetical protein